MANVTYQIEERRQKVHTQTYAVLCLLVALAMGFYTFSKWTEYQLAITGVKENKQFITTLRAEVGNENAAFEAKKTKANQLSEDIENKLKVIFPKTDDYTVLTRKIDEYERDLSGKTDPFEISNIDYQNAVLGDNYAVLPMRMNIRSSSENFTKFLHMVESSGTLKDNVRLMDISSIRLNFEKNAEDTSAPEMINFAVQINAYFQKP